MAKTVAPPIHSEVLAVLTSKTLAEHAEKIGKDVDAVRAQAIIDLLTARGHYLPLGPTAAEAHEAAGQFATQLVFSNLTVSLMNTIVMSGITVPETAPAKEWLRCYITGDGHGPVGQPMLWPAHLLGVSRILRSFGFEPTEGNPAYVRKARPAVQ